MEKSIKRLKNLIEKSNKILVFTGAGISTSSGIPDYRGPHGVWKTRQPVLYQEFISSEEKRLEYWEYKLEGYETFKNAKPNKAHLSLVELEKQGKLLALVTQNIDGLHQAAGHNIDKIIELHGTNSKAECLNCAKIIEIDGLMEEFRKTRKPPKCKCGGYFKPAVVMFGQSIPQDKLYKAFNMAAGCDLVISIGSTLQVEPAASIPLAAYQRGVTYVIINLGETAHDSIANLKIESDAVTILPLVV